MYKILKISKINFFISFFFKKITVIKETTNNKADMNM